MEKYSAFSYFEFVVENIDLNQKSVVSLGTDYLFCWFQDPSKADAASLALLQAAGATTGDPVKDEQLVRDHIKSQNAKKAEAARLR